MKMSTTATLRIFCDKLNADTYKANLEWWLDGPDNLNTFCPIMNGICRSDCVCFEPSNLIEVKQASYTNVRTLWYYYSCYCNNYMLSGRRED